MPASPPTAGCVLSEDAGGSRSFPAAACRFPEPYTELQNDVMLGGPAVASRRFTAGLVEIQNVSPENEHRSAR